MRSFPRDKLLLGLAVLILCAMAFCRLPASVEASRQANGRLDQRISLHVAGQSVGTVLAYLSRTTGVQLEAEPAISSRMITAYLDDVPLSDLQADLASLYGLKWQGPVGTAASISLARQTLSVRSEMPGRQVFRLVNDGNALSVAEAGGSDFQTRLAVWKQWAEAGASGEAAFMSSHQEFFVNQGLPWWVGTDGSPGSGQVIARLFFSLPQSQQDAVLSGQPVRMAWKDVPSEYRQPMEHMIALMVPQQGPTHISEHLDQFSGQLIRTTETTKLLPFAFQNAELVIASSPDDTGSERAIRLTLYHVGVLPPKGALAVANAGERPWEFAFGGQTRLRGFQGTTEEFVGRVMSERIRPLESTDPQAASLLSRPLDVSEIEPYHSFADLLGWLHARHGINILADYHYDRTSLMPVGEVPTGAFVQMLSNLTDRSWSWQNGLLLLRSRDKSARDQQDLPADQTSLLARPETWADPLNGWGIMAQAPITAWNGIAGAEGLRAVAPWTTIWTASRNGKNLYPWNMDDPDTHLLLRLYGQLNPQERAEAKSPSGLSLSELPFRQRDILSQIRSEDLTPYLADGRLSIQIGGTDTLPDRVPKIPNSWWATFQVSAPGLNTWQHGFGAPQVETAGAGGSETRFTGHTSGATIRPNA